MRPLAIYLGIGWLLIVLQLSVIPFVPFPDLRPDLVFFVVLFLGIYHGTLSAAVLAFFLGYLLDLVASTPFGLNSFLALLLFFTVDWIGQRADSRQPTFAAIALAGFSAFEILLFWFWEWLLNPGGTLPAGLIAALFLRITGNLVFGLPVLSLLKRTELWRKGESGLQL